MFLKRALKSGELPRLMLLTKNGSNAGNFSPSPKSPLARRGRNLFIESITHSLIFGSLRLHTFMVEAGKIEFRNLEIELDERN
jgi:hypothetical protein